MDHKKNLGTNISQLLKTMLLKCLGVLWFTPFYVGVLVAFGEGVIWLQRQMIIWLVDTAFQNTLLYGGTLFYGALLIYLACTHRVWLPNSFLRFTVRYPFLLPKWGRRIPGYILAVFPGLVYFFPFVVKGVSEVHTMAGIAITEGNVMLQTQIVTGAAIAISWAFAAVITHMLFKHCHFIKVHALHELGA